MTWTFSERLATALSAVVRCRPVGCGPSTDRRGSCHVSPLHPVKFVRVEGTLLNPTSASSS
jgi:hypothetical protein